LYNPQSFLTAICQVTAQKQSLELDKLVTYTEVTKKISASEIDSPASQGVYVTGLAIQGARWDSTLMTVDRSKPKEMYCVMPVINVKAVLAEKGAEEKGIYNCPVYKTEQRGPTFVFCAQLKTKSPPARWVLAGVALIMDIA
jgi:dynein heavy chain